MVRRTFEFIRQPRQLVKLPIVIAMLVLAAVQWQTNDMTPGGLPWFATSALGSVLVLIDGVWVLRERLAKRRSA